MNARAMIQGGYSGLGKRTLRRSRCAGMRAGHRTVIVEFIVDDVDAEFRRLQDLLTDVVTEPKDMPWEIASCSSGTRTAI